MVTSMRWIVAVALLVGALTLVTTVDRPTVRAAGCTTPPDEKKLLDAYENDPAFTRRPPGARGDDPVRARGCIQLNREDVSATSVRRRWHSDRAYLTSELEDLYGRNGWERFQLAPDGAALHLHFCRVIRNVVSRLDVYLRENPSDDDPYTLDVGITAHTAETKCA